jgi:hypothetical protein
LRPVAGVVTQVGKAPPSPEMTISGLTRGRLVGEDQIAKRDLPRLCRTLRPAPQAGCFVSRLVPPKTQRKSLYAIGHSAPQPERRQARRRIQGPSWRHLLRLQGSRDPPLAEPRALGAAAAALEMCQLRLGASRLLSRTSRRTRRQDVRRLVIRTIAPPYGKRKL